MRWNDETERMGTMSDMGMGSEVKADLTIDTDTIEVVHDRLIRKGNQNAKRAAVIDAVRGYVQDSKTIDTADKFKLGIILNQDCD